MVSEDIVRCDVFIDSESARWGDTVIVISHHLMNQTACDSDDHCDCDYIQSL